MLRKLFVAAALALLAFPAWAQIGPGCPISTTIIIGCVKPDGTTITVTAAGTITAVGAAPTGAAGGALTGTYPNPTIASGATIPTPTVTGVTTILNTTGAAALPAALAGTILQSGTADTNGNRIELDAWAGTGIFTGRRANGTIASPTTLVSGNIIASLSGVGHDGTGYSTTTAGSVNVVATETWSGTAHGTEIGIATTPNASLTAAFVAKFGQNGSFTVGTTSGTGTGALFAGATTLTSTVNFTGIAAAAGADILCYNATGGPVTYATSVVGCVPSAARFKDFRDAIDPKAALAGVMGLTAATYSYKPKLGLGGNIQAGLVADEVCKIDRRLCHWDANGEIDNYDKTGMFATLVAAFQEYVRTHP